MPIYIQSGLQYINQGTLICWLLVLVRVYEHANMHW